MVLRGNIKPYFNQIVIIRTLEEMSFAEKKKWCYQTPVVTYKVEMAKDKIFNKPDN